MIFARFRVFFAITNHKILKILNLEEEDKIIIIQLSAWPLRLIILSKKFLNRTKNDFDQSNK